MGSFEIFKRSGGIVVVKSLAYVQGLPCYNFSDWLFPVSTWQYDENISVTYMFNHLILKTISKQKYNDCLCAALSSFC